MSNHKMSGEGLNPDPPPNNPLPPPQPGHGDTLFHAKVHLSVGEAPAADCTVMLQVGAVTNQNSIAVASPVSGEANFNGQMAEGTTLLISATKTGYLPVLLILPHISTDIDGVHQFESSVDFEVDPSHHGGGGAIGGD